MTVTATKIVEEPITEITAKKNVTGVMPPSPPPADTPILIAEATPPKPVAPTTAEAAPAQLPKTGSELPLIGFLGSLFVAAYFGLRRLRKLL